MGDIQPSTSFVYDELDRNETEIRLLHIFSRYSPEPSGGRLRAKLVTTRLSSAPPYSALSYTWGDSDTSQSIELNGHEFQITQNLWEALNTVCPENENLVIWVDAICLNQENLLERNHQVKKMRTIYQQADQVIIWIGPMYDDSHFAFRFINQLHERRESSEALLKQFDDPDAIRSLKALGSVFMRSYWSRVWIVQEVTLAKNAVVYCGTDCISLSAMGMIQDRLWPVKIGSSHTDVSLRLFELLADDQGVRAAIKWRGPRPIQLTQDAATSGTLSFFELLQYHFVCKATNPKDYIYGFAGIVSRAARESVEIDYARTLVRVYIDFVAQEVKTSKRLDVISKVIFDPQSTSELPTWVADWSRIKPGHIFFQSIFEPQYCYNAGGDTEAEVTISEDEGIMFMQAIVLGKIDEFGNLSNAEDCDDTQNALPVMYDWYRLACDGLDGDVLKTRQQSFCRSLLAGHLEAKDYVDYGPSLSVSDFLLGLLGCWIEEHDKVCQPRRFENEQLRDLVAFRKSKFISNAENDRGWPAWVQTMSNIMWDRRIFFGTNGIMGLGPGVLEKGDILTIPLGCSTPMILRQRLDHFLVIGEAYVDGFMKGEALENLKRGEFTIQTFELR